MSSDPRVLGHLQTPGSRLTEEIPWIGVSQLKLSMCLAPVVVACLGKVREPHRLCIQSPDSHTQPRGLAGDFLAWCSLCKTHPMRKGQVSRCPPGGRRDTKNFPSAPPA